MDTERPDRNEQFVDEVLEASLAQYSRTEPRLGLEGRVLRRLEEARRERRLGWLGRWQWAAAGAVAVIVVSVSLVSLRERQTPGEIAVLPKPAGGSMRMTPTAPEVVSPRAAVSDVSPARRTPRFNVVRPQKDATLLPSAMKAKLMVVSAAPRQAAFPSAAPLSEQERLLAQAAASGNPVVLDALSAAQAPIKELEIKPLKIEPLPGSETTSDSGATPPKF